MNITSVADITVMHCHSGTPRPYNLRGEYLCLTISADEFLRLSSQEVHRFTRTWSQAYTFCEDGSGKFYLKPKPKWRYLATLQNFGIDELRMILALTTQSKARLVGNEARRLLQLAFLEARSLNEWKQDNASHFEISYRGTDGGVDVEVTLPRDLLSLLRTYPQMFTPGCERLKKLSPSVHFVPS